MNKIESFLRNLSTDENDYHRLVTQIKELILGENSDIYFLYGQGNNGKTMLMDLIRKALGNDLRIVPHSFLGDEFNQSALLSLTILNKYIEVPEMDHNDYNTLDIPKLQDLLSTSTQRKIIFVGNMDPPYGTKGIQFNKTFNNSNSNYNFCMNVINHHANDLLKFLENY